MRALAATLIPALALALAACSAGQPEPPEAATPAAAEVASEAPTAEAEGTYLPDPDRKYPTRVLWGDQHVHTAWSADAGGSLG